MNTLFLKTLVNNGWTIANRKVVTSEIGKEKFEQMVDLARSANLVDSFSYSEASPYLTKKNIQKTQNILTDIIDSYRDYARSPYVNEFLRSDTKLSEKSKKIVDSLRLAISNNKVSGRFVRGLSPTRANKLETIEDVSTFVFNNKGFTSAVPEKNSDYANCFALGRNGVKVIFDVDNMPGYKASEYEVLFDLNAFTKDKFDIVQVGEKMFKVSPKNN